MPDSPVGQSVSPPRTYTIEVCAICGGQLNNRYNRAGQGGSAPNGRCGNDRSHWSAGGVLLDVTPLPLSQQAEARFLRGLVAAGVVLDAWEI